MRRSGAQPVWRFWVQSTGGATRKGQDLGCGRADTWGDPNKVASVKNTPVLILYGDNAKDHPRWSKIRQGGVEYAALLKSAGGHVDVVDLPERGVKGNSHMMMMDRNSDAVAGLIQGWLVDRELSE